MASYPEVGRQEHMVAEGASNFVSPSPLSAGDIGSPTAATWEKYEELKRLLAEMERVIVGFSGGVDSTFVLKAAAEALGEQVVAVTSNSESYPERELAQAQALCAELGVRHRLVRTHEMDLEGYRENSPNRCYHCKTELYTVLKRIAAEEGARWIVNGANVDDTGDHRPGMVAADEHEVRSPLLEAGLSKLEVRQLSRALGLPTWNKPALPCLASRFPYGTFITVEGLGRVERAEDFLRDLGLRDVRVRYHEDLARIEALPEEMGLLIEHAARVVHRLKKLGFQHVTMDLQGFRSGSLNEGLRDDQKVVAAARTRSSARETT